MFVIRDYVRLCRAYFCKLVNFVFAAHVERVLVIGVCSRLLDTHFSVFLLLFYRQRVLVDVCAVMCYVPLLYLGMSS